MMAILFLGLAACLLSACNDEMDVQQSYPFKVETLPVPTRIVKGETVEIRCELKREGRFSDARYTIRYFQPDGKGTLRMDDGMVLLPNDRYPLDREVFRLYYTSESEMMKLKAIWFAVLSITVFFPGMPSRAENPIKASPDRFSIAVECVKRFEGWHGEKKHWPYVGWGHKVLPGERFTNSITKAQGDSILRADLRKLCRMFSYLGRDSLIVSVLAYNVGCSRIKGYGKIPKSRLLKKLESGDRDIYKEYVSFRCYKGKVVPSIERRRKVEYMLLFEK